MSKISSVTSSTFEQNHLWDSPEQTQQQEAVLTKLLLVKWEIAVRAEAWVAAATVAKAIIGAMPNEVIGWIYHAFAEQQLGQLSAARQTLLLASRKFPNDWRVAYNLACYNAQLGDGGGACNWLDRALELGDIDVVRSCASQEPSLKALKTMV